MAKNTFALGFWALVLSVLSLACSSDRPPEVPPAPRQCLPDVASECPDGDKLCLRTLGIKVQQGPLRERDYQKASEYWTCACEGDDAVACRHLGVLNMRGEGAPPNVDRAEELFDGACHDGDGDACAWLGLLWAQTGQKKPEEAMPWIRKGCDMGGSMACGRLGAAYALGKYVDAQDLPSAKMLLTSACKQQDAYACRLMGALARGQEQNEARATGWYEKSCQLEDAEGCFELGRSRTQRAVAQLDPKKGAIAFEHGCLLGSGEACNAFGELKLSGEGTTQDQKAAALLFKEACEGKSKAGCANWGRALSQGLGTDKNVAAAFVPMSIGCEGNDPQACTWLGAEYASGENAEQHPAKALEHLDKACRLNSWIGCRLFLSLSGGVDNFGALAAEVKTRMKTACDGRDFNACYQLGLLVAAQPAALPVEGDFAAKKKALLDKVQVRAENVALFELACTGKVEDACLRAGTMLAHPLDGVDGQYPRAIELLLPLCEAKNPAACNELGVLYANGKGVKADRTHALTLFKEACEGGENTACRRAAVGFENGWGTDKNPEEAIKYNLKGCQLGCTECCSKDSP